MKTSIQWLLACSAGLLSGWTAAVWWKTAETHRGPVGSSRSVDIKESAKPLRTRITGSSPLADVQACRDLLAASAGSDDRHPLLRKLDRERALRRWIELDPGSALAEAERDPSGDFGKDLFLAWVELDPANALDALNGTNRSLAGFVAADVFVALMAKDPLLAAAELQEPRWKNEGTAFLGWGFRERVGRQWMLSDPAAAIASLGKADPSKQLDEAQNAIAGQWAEMDFAAAWKHFHPTRETPDASLSETASTLLARGLLSGAPEALRALGELPPYSSSDPRRAAEISGWGSLADFMVRYDPRAALDWRASARPMIRCAWRYSVKRPLRSQVPIRSRRSL